MNETKDIENKIYEIRGLEVMLDSDLATVYNCANGTKAINQAVKRNIERFPNDFYFQLTNEEYVNLKSQNVTARVNGHGGARKMPFAFTEQGVAMLATVIKTDMAAITSINIMRAFVRMRHYINYNKDVLPNRVLLIEEKVDINSKRIDELFDRFDPKIIAKNCLFFKGRVFDAHITLLNILNLGKKEIIIIDNYAGKEILNILKDFNKKIIIVSSNIVETLKNKYLKQYSNITFIKNDSFHDRFIIIDRKKAYHSGASFKDLGKKCFGINEVENKNEINRIIEDIFNKYVKK